MLIFFHLHFFQYLLIYNILTQLDLDKPEGRSPECEHQNYDMTSTKRMFAKEALFLSNQLSDCTSKLQTSIQTYILSQNSSIYI